MYIQSKSTNNLYCVKDYMILCSNAKVKMSSNFTRLTKIQRSSYYRGLKLWDQLPDHVQKESSKKSLKKRLSNVLLEIETM